MIHAQEIWDIMHEHMNLGKWFYIEDIYSLIEKYHTLEKDDFLPQAPKSTIPKWKRNVRNVLQHRKSVGDLAWDGNRNYMRLS
jgi:hypothetical protein